MNQTVEQKAAALRDALQACRAQWIHSVNAPQCLAALALAERQTGQNSHGNEIVPNVLLVSETPNGVSR